MPGFLHVLDAIKGAGCRLVSPLQTIQWNLDKRYLAVLVAIGLPVVPTAFIGAGDQSETIITALDGLTGGRVVKPVVGVGGYGVQRLPDRRALAAAFAGGGIVGPCLVHPFLPAVTSEGEWSFIFAAGRFLHATLKTPKPGDFRVQVMYGARTVQRRPEVADLAVARQCYEALPVPAQIARIDMARLLDGRLALMEAELIEPQLCFHDVPGAADLVAAAVADLLAG